MSHPVCRFGLGYVILRPKYLLPNTLSREIVSLKS